jgi:hydroxymethylpyrimidine kinase/phosphomethylpyrimidine kinase
MFTRNCLAGLYQSPRLLIAISPVILTAGFEFIMTDSIKTVMTIAGLDPSAGAGVLADIKTISAFGCYGVAAVTSLTYQNTQGVYGAHNPSGEILSAQIKPLFDDFDIAAVKTGMLPTEEVIKVVVESFSGKQISHLVVDPVVRSTSGYDLIDDIALRALLNNLFPLASVVTPNSVEAERITGIEVKDEESMLRAAERMLDLGPRAVLVKGGDMTGDIVIDLLLDQNGDQVFIGERIKSKNTHGTGCTLSSALASLLALGYELNKAVAIARSYVVEGIRSAPGLGYGYGPLNHFPQGFGIE